MIIKKTVTLILLVFIIMFALLILHNHILESESKTLAIAQCQFTSAGILIRNSMKHIPDTTNWANHINLRKIDKLCSGNIKNEKGSIIDATGTQIDLIVTLKGDMLLKRVVGPDGKYIPIVHNDLLIEYKQRM